MSFGLCERIWKVFDIHFSQLLLMMSDCPLEIRHKKGDYIWIGDFVDRGRFCVVLELWSFRLYLGASSCIYIFWLMMYFVLF